MFSLIKEINELVELSNKIVSETGPTSHYDRGDWVAFFETRSFIAICMSILFTVLSMFGIVIPFGETFATDAIFNITALIFAAWAFIERIFGKKRVIWNKIQADKALDEAISKAKAIESGGLY